MNNKLITSIKAIESDYIGEIKIDEDILFFQTILFQSNKFLNVTNINFSLLSSLGLEISYQSGNYFIIKNKNTSFKKIEEGDMLLLINDMLPYDYFVCELNSNSSINILALRGCEKEKVLVRDEIEKIDFKEIKEEMVVKPIVLGQNRYLYIYINTFGDLLNDALDGKLNKYDNVIIDLRNHMGGSFKQMVSSLNKFIHQDDKYFRIHGKLEQKFRHLVKAEGSKNINTVIVLIGNNTMSSAEIFAGFLRENTSAILVGQKSYGKNFIHKNVTLDNGYSVNIPKYEVVLDNNIFDKGLSPDIIIENLDKKVDINSIVMALENNIAEIDLFFKNR